jgi:predicted MPP superfamily phosphohydrolase
MTMAILFFVLFLALYTGANIYIPSRLATLFGIKKRKILYILFAVAAVSIPLSMMLHRAMANTITSIYYLISTTWMGMFFYLLILLLLFEIVNIFIKPPKKISGITIISLTVLISLYSLWNAQSFTVNRVEIPIEGLTDEVKIVQISDVHIDNFRGKSYLEKIVNATNEQKPDLVLITGDIIDSSQALTEEIFSPLKKLTAPAYFTTGNHESYADFDKSVEIMAKSNLRILRNEIIETHNIQLIGLDYMNADEQSFDMHKVNKLTMKETLPTLDISPGKPSVLMHHSPVGLDYVNRRGINLMLSGHTHGGQMFPATYINRMIFPYNKGLYNYKGTYVYVSQGAGTFGPRMRLGTNNEITVIVLTKSKSQ